MKGWSDVPWGRLIMSAAKFKAAQWIVDGGKGKPAAPTKALTPLWGLVETMRKAGSKGFCNTENIEVKKKEKYVRDVTREDRILALILW